MPQLPAIRQASWASVSALAAVRLCGLRALAGVLLGLLLSCILVAAAFADSFEDRRVRTGARIFRSLLAADMDLGSKSGAGVTIWVIGNGDVLQQDVHELIASQSDPTRARIQNLPVNITAYQRFEQVGPLPTPVAVFFVTPPKEAEFKQWLAWSTKHHTVLFSPFEGHVERGMTAGISIQAKVQPLLNQRQMQAVKLRLKPFFLRVAKVWP